jgi:hypothetical protein
MALTEREQRLVEALEWFRNIHHEVQHGRMRQHVPGEEHIEGCPHAGTARNLIDPEGCSCPPREVTQAHECPARSCAYANKVLEWAKTA